jgi:hypothetical protein
MIDCCSPWNCMISEILTSNKFVKSLKKLCMLGCSQYLLSWDYTLCSTPRLLGTSKSSKTDKKVRVTPWHSEPESVQVWPSLCVLLRIVILITSLFHPLPVDLFRPLKIYIFKFTTSKSELKEVHTKTEDSSERRNILQLNNIQHT